MGGGQAKIYQPKSEDDDDLPEIDENDTPLLINTSAQWRKDTAHRIRIIIVAMQLM